MGKEDVFAKIDCVIKDGKENLYNNYRDNLMSEGIPGKILLLSSMQDYFSKKEYNALVNDYIPLLVYSLEKHGLYNHSLYSGTSGVGMSIYSISEKGTLYYNLLKSLNQLLIEQLEVFLKNINEQDLKVTDYDVISGIAGTAQYLMLWKKDKTILNYLHKCLRFLVNIILNKKIVDNREVPNVFITSKNQMTEIEAKLVPNGAVNTGVAHGIAGVGMILALAYINGIEINGQKEAIRKIVAIYEDNMCLEDGKIYWKNNLEPAITHDNFKYFIRDGWCYGSPGISLFFLYAGQALQDKSYTEFAEQIFLNAINNLCGIFSPILCHGYTGLVEISREFYRISSKSAFKEAEDFLKNKVIKFYHDEYIYGFRDYESSNDSNGKDNIGFLDGVIGIYLALLEEGKKNNFWNKMLLIQ